MKKLLVLALAISGIIFTASAQHKGAHRMHSKKQKHAQVPRQLNLSEAQKMQAKANKTEFKQKIKDLNKNETITVKEQRDRKEALRKEHHTNMQALLTPQQKTKMAELKAAKKIKRDESFAKRLDKMKSKINLSDNQIAQLKNQRESIKARFKAIKENENLNRIQRKEQMMALKAEAKAQRIKLFTAEQLKQLEEMKKNNKMHKKHEAK